MKKILSSLTFVVLWVLLMPLAAGQHAPIGSDDIVILYENDVHGSIEGYPLLASLRDEMKALTPNVSVVSCGDFLSGTSLGSASRGRYLVRLMNAVGYDYVTLGNHEFDFGIDTLSQRMAELSATVLCGNFANAGDSLSHYQGYAIHRYGYVSVAFVGATTPTVPTSSTPIFFQDSAGQWLYTFYPHNLDSVVQRYVDAARLEGADYVVLLSHLGDNDLPPLVAATRGIDVVLDGHSHSVIPHTLLRNRDGKEVLWTSTGSNFRHIGLLHIHHNGTPQSTLLRTDSIPPASNAVADTLSAIRQAYAAIGQRKVGYSRVDLWRKWREGDYIDAPLGNFFCDAFRVLTGAEIALMNAGGIRNDIHRGNLVFDDLYSAAPFDNQLCLVEISGQSLLDGLELGCRNISKVGGGFLYVSGLIYEIDTLQPSTVVCDENGVLLRVEGERRVRNVRVWDVQRQQYLPLDPERIYRVAGCDYTLLKHGDGHNFPDVRIIRPSVCPYVEALEAYLKQNLGGTIGDPYSVPQGRIVLR